MATITNQARITYSYGAVNAAAASNIATATLTEPLTGSKTSLGSTYTAGDEITYILSLTNGSANAATDITVSDNLGRSTAGGVAYTPLSYVGPAYLYINGVYTSELTPATIAGSLIFTLPSIPAGANAVIIYKAALTSEAPLTSGSTVTNTATFTSPTLGTAEKSNTITVENYARLNIVKSMSPNPVVGGGQLTYTFTVYNYGNDAATDVVLTDVFSPAPTDITVTVNGTAVSAENYTYTGGTLTLPAAGSSYEITVPAATFTTDTTTGAVTASPGVTVVEVTGTI